MLDPSLREDGPTITNTLLRQFAGLWTVVFGGLALVEHFSRHRSGRALVFALVAAVVGGLGLVRPAAIRPLWTAAMAIAAPIGWLVSHVLLAIVFYLLFLPVALVFRLMGRDALARRFNQRAPTYWHKWQQPDDARSYLHQS